jgi:large subunit ribosomal protein L9
MFGSVTSQNITEALEAQGYTIDKRKILLEEPIKSLGIYSVPIKLHADVEAKVKVWVVKE